MSEQYLPCGQHVIVDVIDCYTDLNNPPKLESIMREELEAGGASILNCHAAKFEPQGCTIAFVLAESHATIHTYPEHNSYMMDIFTCGDTIKPSKIAARISGRIGGNYDIRVIDRGLTLKGENNGRKQYGLRGCDLQSV